MAFDHHHNQQLTAEINRAGVIAATLCLEMRAVHPVQAGSCPGTARDSGDRGVLPGSVEVQMWKQIVHAMMHGFCFIWYLLVS